MRRNKFSFLPMIFIMLISVFAASYYYIFSYMDEKHSNLIKLLNSPSKPQKQISIDFTSPWEAPDRPVTLSFAGDCTIGSDPKFSYNTFHQKYKEVNNPEYFFSGVKDIFADDDLTIVNFEGTLTESHNRANKKFTFKGPPEYAKIISSGSIELVNLANNHSFDYQQKGFDDTRKNLSNENIDYFGFEHIHTSTIRGIPMAFLGYKGWLDTINLDSVKKTIKKYKEDGYFVVVNYHWGLEGRYHPIWGQTHVAHTSIDSGADLIIGHHPHVLEGFEIYKDKLIAYSLGNFCFGGNSNPRDKRTMILQIELPHNPSQNGYSFRVIPTKLSSLETINDFQPTIITDRDGKEVFFDFINHISTDFPFIISDDYIKIKD